MLFTMNIDKTGQNNKIQLIFHFKRNLIGCQKLLKFRVEISITKTSDGSGTMIFGRAICNHILMVGKDSF